MNIDKLNDIANRMVAPGKGILAADEVDRLDHQALRIDQARRRPRTTAATIARCCSAPPMR